MDRRTTGLQRRYRASHADEILNFFMTVQQNFNIVQYVGTEQKLPRKRL